MNGTGASRKCSIDAGNIGTYTCCQVNGNINDVRPSATSISRSNSTINASKTCICCWNICRCWKIWIRNGYQLWIEIHKCTEQRSPVTIASIGIWMQCHHHFCPSLLLFFFSPGSKPTFFTNPSHHLATNSALEVRFSRHCAIQIDVYLYLTFTINCWCPTTELSLPTLCFRFFMFICFSYFFSYTFLLSGLVQ